MLKNKIFFSNWQTFKRFWLMIFPFKLGLFIAVIALIINATSDIFMLSLLRPLLDENFNTTNNNILIWMPLAIISLITLRGISGFISSYCISWVSNKVIMNMRQKLFKHIMNMPVFFFDKQSTATLLSRITYDSEQVASLSSDTLITIIREGSSIIGLFIMMFYHSWLLSFILLIIAPIVFWIIKLISKRFRQISKKMQNTMGQIAVSTEQMLKGHKEVLIFGGKAVENKRFYIVSNNMRQQAMKMITAASISEPLIQLIASLALAFILYAASNPSIKATLTAGTITVVFSSMIALMRPLKSLTIVNTKFQRGMAACQTLFSILDTETEKDEGTINVTHVKGNIIFKQVTFSYPGKKKPLFNNINLSITAGNTVALVGRSGSGKSTITKLLARFYDVQHGKIMLDGIDLREYTLSSLRNQIAVVSQNIHLFNDTIANNIAYACNDIYSRKQIEKAASMAYAMDFIETMNKGLDTIIGENGTLLSGGQRQRIAIARALLRNCPILILDEATSALDIESEQAIQKALNELQNNQTLLIIAHRLSTIKKVDNILVIEEGKIIERGNHIELMAYRGVYAQLYKMQLNQ